MLFYNRHPPLPNFPPFITNFKVLKGTLAYRISGLPRFDFSVTYCRRNKQKWMQTRYSSGVLIPLWFVRLFSEQKNCDQSNRTDWTEIAFARKVLWIKFSSSTKDLLKTASRRKGCSCSCWGKIWRFVAVSNNCELKVRAMRLIFWLISKKPSDRT